MKIFFTIAVLFFVSCSTRSGKPAYTSDEDSTILTAQNYFDAIKTNDIKLSTPKPGEWLYEHPENGQSFEDYKNGKPVKVGVGRSIIFLRPIGSFTGSQLKILELTREYLEIFFQQKTILMEPIADKIIPANARRDNGNEQLLAPYILDSLLKNKIPTNGFASMAITEKDLYPQDDWNYVFGLASYKNRVGVSSIYRLQEQKTDTTNFTLCLKRLISIASHEIGHMFSIDHCTFAKCVMNGGNSLAETDQAPNRLCSECQKKIFWNIKYDNEKRLLQLRDFFQQNKLWDDLNMAKKDKENLYN